MGIQVIIDSVSWIHKSQKILIFLKWYSFGLHTSLGLAHCNCTHNQFIAIPCRSLEVLACFFEKWCLLVFFLICRLPTIWKRYGRGKRFTRGEEVRHNESFSRIAYLNEFEYQISASWVQGAGDENWVCRKIDVVTLGRRIVPNVWLERVGTRSTININMLFFLGYVRYLDFQHFLEFGF